MCKQPFQFRREKEDATFIRNAIEQRLYAKAITGEQQAAFAAIEQRDGEHAVDRIEEREVVLEVEVRDDLRGASRR